MTEKHKQMTIPSSKNAINTYPIKIIINQLKSLKHMTKIDHLKRMQL